MIALFISFNIILVIVGVSDGLKFIKPENVNRNFVVSTNNGFVQGRTGITFTGRPYWAYEGIPYATPPVGSLRFTDPEPTTSWIGVLDASEEGPTCVETVNTINRNIEVFGQEDCLYLNVYTPRNPVSSTSLLPIMIWIYGGAFMFGNSSKDTYGSDNFLDQDVIVVTFNYRVGMFGFLSTEDMESPGNYGLKDQHLAIKWVSQNIKNFGGNKNRVTIMGQSAGSASVLYQVASEKNKGLFQSAIANSGSPLCNWAFQRNPRKVAFDVGLGVGIRTKSSKELVARLRKASIEKLKKVSRTIFILFVPQNDREGFPFGPSLEPPYKGGFITRDVYTTYLKGEFTRVPVLMGINSLETLFFSDVLELLKPLNFLYDLSPGSLPNKAMNIRTPEERRDAGKRIINQYFSGGSYISASEIEYLQYTSDDRFTRPLHKTVQLISRHAPLYYYLFSYVGEYGATTLKGISEFRPVKGVAHLEEQFYMWRRKGTPLPIGLDQLMARRLIKIMVNFIKTRNPTPVKDELLQRYIWPTVTNTKNITYLQIDADISLHKNYRGNEIQFWENLYQQYGHPPYLTY